MDLSKKFRTIQIFLPQGDPLGLRIAELTTSIMRCIEVPRNHIKYFLGMVEAKQVGMLIFLSIMSGYLSL